MEDVSYQGKRDANRSREPDHPRSAHGRCWVDTMARGAALLTSELIAPAHLVPASVGSLSDPDSDDDVDEKTDEDEEEFATPSSESAPPPDCREPVIRCAACRRRRLAAAAEAAAEREAGIPKRASTRRSASASSAASMSSRRDHGKGAMGRERGGEVWKKSYFVLWELWDRAARRLGSEGEGKAPSSSDQHRACGDGTSRGYIRLQNRVSRLRHCWWGFR